METSVIIAGGGIVGASLACALAGSIDRVELIETQAVTSWHEDDEHDLRVYAISPGSRRFLERIGAWPKIAARRYCVYRGMEVWDAEGTGSIRFDCQEVFQAALGYIVEHRVLAAALADCLELSQAIHRHCPATLTRVEHLGKTVIAELDSGIQLSAQLLVGADGADSSVRSTAGIPFERRLPRQRAIVANVSTEKPHQHTAWQRFLPGGPVAFLPLSDGRSSIVWSLPEGEADSLLSLDADAFCKRLAEAFDHRLGAIRSCTERRSFPIMSAMAERFIGPRTVLVGDAAHVIHPLAGQGLNLGLADAQTLAGILKDAGSDPGKERSLRRYERARRTDSALMMHFTDGMNTLFHQSNPPIPRLRNLGLDLANRSGPIKRWMMQQALGTADGTHRA